MKYKKPIFINFKIIYINLQLIKIKLQNKIKLYIGIKFNKIL